MIIYPLCNAKSLVKCVLRQLSYPFFFWHVIRFNGRNCPQKCLIRGKNTHIYSK